MREFNFRSFETGAPVWSCCYDQLDINLVYAGCSNGCIYGYDLRRISDPICKYAIEENSSLPIHSLAFDSQSKTLLVGSLGGVFVVKNMDTFSSEKPIALELPKNLRSGNKGTPYLFLL